MLKYYNVNLATALFRKKLIQRTLIAALLLSLCSCTVKDYAALTSTETKQYNYYSPTNVYVDSDAFLHNLKLLRKLIPYNVKIMAIMKGDAYGNGISNLTEPLIQANIDYVGVTENYEMLALREGEVNNNILRVRQPTLKEVEDILVNSERYGTIDEMIGSAELAEEINKLAVKYNKIIPVHINLNSLQMGRSGIDLSTKEGRDEIKTILKLKNLKVAGIMSHFPSADADDLTDSLKHLEEFKKQAAWIMNEGDLNKNEVLLHTAASIAALRMPESHLDMVRLGAVIYGYKGVKESPEGLKDLITFKSHICSIMNFPKGSLIGYSSKAELKRDSKLANIPLGKANGVPFNLEYVLIQGKKFKCVGAMSMNIIVVDITDHAEDIQLDDEVVIVGSQKGTLGKDSISLKDIFEETGTIIPYLNLFIGNNNYMNRKPLN